MTSEYIMALDEGTTSARAVIYDHSGTIQGTGQFEFEQIYPNPGWVEHDPSEIWDAQKRSMDVALDEAGLEPDDMAAIGITNQRQTTVPFDAETGVPVHNAIVWQDMRTTEMLEELNEEYGKEIFAQKTGLVPDEHPTGTNIKWYLDNKPEIADKAETGEVLLSSIDSYLIYRLTGGDVYATDYSNASRTMLFDIHELEWDDELMEILGVPEAILPEVKESSEIYGYTDEDVFGAEVPIAGVAGDQHAALFGQACYEPGMVKNTYGTGNFMFMNTGTEPYESDDLLTTIAWGLDGEAVYALEGSIYTSGASVQWLRDDLNIIEVEEEVEVLAKSVDSNEGIYFIPAFSGLNAPYWNKNARGTLVGVTRGAGRAQLARAVLESTAYYSHDIVEVMEEDTDIALAEIRVDGGAAHNDFLMGFQADISGTPVVRPEVLETTSLGASYLAGLAVDYWEDQDEIEALWQSDEVFEPDMPDEKRTALHAGWKKAVERSLDWAEELREAGIEIEE
ncbi:glycerol kinase GlpK [Halobacteriaceae archaeon SHR40]|uniref:glycerol kinase GlpK n=1 Tax=Halovenus amylolytica TaxID=2500550 RepID=UPI000FE30416